MRHKVLKYASRGKLSMRVLLRHVKNAGKKFGPKVLRKARKLLRKIGWLKKLRALTVRRLKKAKNAMALKKLLTRHKKIVVRVGKTLKRLHNWVTKGRKLRK